MKSNITKRVWSVILVFAMVLSFLPNGLIFARASEATNGSKTDGQIVADNYALTEAEKKLIASGYLIGATHNYAVPDANDDLISVDTDNKTVTAKTYEGTSGYKWMPVSADIVVGNEVMQTIQFTDGKATYDPEKAGDAFAVKVKYELKLDVDESTQKDLLNAPSYLQQALQVMKTLKQVREKLSALELDEAVEIFRQMTANDGFVITTGFSFVFQTKKLNDAAKYTEREAALLLLAQMDANPGNKLNISVLADDYAAAKDSNTALKFIIENADTIKAEITTAYEYLFAITADGCTWNTAAVMAGYASHPMASALNSVLGSLKTAVELLADAGSKDASLAAAKNVVKSGLTTLEYQALDTLAALGDATLAGPSIEVKNPLVADTATVQFNMAMFDVKVSVVLKTAGAVGSTGLVTFDTETATLTLKEGATAADIKAALEKNGLVSQALAGWNGTYVANKFERTETTLPDTLKADTEYVITYAPKLYTLNMQGQGVEQVPYGYRFVLPVHEDAGKAYDYKVNGTYFAQGSTYTVTDMTEVTFTEGKAYDYYTVNGLVADVYFAGSNKAQSILNSGALKIGNEIVNVRTPDNSKGIVVLEENKLTAQTYASDYQGLLWVPYTYEVILNGNVIGNGSFNGATSVTINAADFDRVEVTYRLSLTNLDSDYVLQVANLPAVLVAEANEQLRILNALASNASAMDTADRATLGGVQGVVNTSTMAQHIKEQIVAAIDGVLADCINAATGELKLYEMMVQYNDPNNGGLRYYYQNSEAIIREIKALAGYLNELLGDGDNTELKDALVELLESNSAFASYVSKIDQIDELKAQVNAAAEIPAPNANIDLTNAVALGKLAEALETTGTVASFTEAETLYIDSNPIVVNAETKVTITATVTKPGTTININAQTFDKNHVLTQGDINALIQELEKAIAKLNADSFFYANNYNEADIQALVGQKASNLNLAFNWTAKTFTVEVEGAEDQTISIDNLEINLPASTDPMVRYEYSVDGANKNAGVYKFTEAQVKKLFASSSTYKITRKAINVGEEDLVKFVNDLNTAIGNNGIVFALTKDASGNYAIVMKINAANVSETGAAVKGMAMELAQSYTYVAFGDNAMIYDGGNGTEISLQAVINTIMESSFGTEALNKLIDANGNILNIAMPGTVISDKAMEAAGGKLALTSLVLGSSADVVNHDVPLYITLGSAPSYLTQLRNLLANQLAPYFNFGCENGKINVGLTLPGKAYEAYLAVLLASDQADITDVNSINEKVALGFMMDVIHPLMQSDASLSSVQNTLAQFGYNIDLSGYDQAFEYLRKLYNSTEFGYSDANSTYDANATVSIKGFVDEMNLGSLGNMIAEYQTGLQFTVSVNLENLDKEYQALFFDIGASGITNKFGLVTDLAAKLPEIAGTSVVILLSDVTGNLTFNTTSVLNLNGYKVTGDVTGTTSLRIVDTIIDDGVYGTITGTISGNVKIAGGKYDSDVSAFLTEGYSQIGGVVENDFFNLVKDENGNISVQINAGALNTNKLPEIRTLAVDIIAELLVNGYTANSLTVDGIPVYKIEVENLIEIYTGTQTVNTLLNELMDGVNLNDIKTLLNRILADATDFSGMLAIMNNNIANGTNDPLLTYAITTGVWGFTVNYDELNDTIDGSIVSKGEKDRNLNVVVVGTTEDQQHFANLLEILADTTDADVSINSMTGGKVEGGFKFELGGSGNVVVNMTSDPKYAVMLNVILADGIGAPANAELVAGLKEYFENGTMDALAAAFNKIKVSQVIDAVENVYRGENLTTMLANLGLSDYDAGEAVELDAEVGAFVKLVGALLRRVNINGTATTLGALINPTTGAYTFDKENISRDLTVTLGGYNFTFDGTLVDGYIAIKLFGDPGAPTVDYTELNNQLDRADQMTDKYTNATYVPFKAAWDAAKDALLSDDQAVVDAAAEALKNAIDALVAMDYTELEAQISAAENVSGRYTNATYAPFKAAWNAAKDARYSYDQAVVDQAAADLEAAIAALVPMDYAKLDAQISIAENKTESLYTPESWAVMQDALTAAYAAKNSYDQAVVDQAAADLEAAIAALDEYEPIVIDYEALKAQIAIAGTYEDQELNYSEASWNAMQAALVAANNALSADNQPVVDKATADLEAAIAALHLMDYTELEEAIKEAEELDETKYTAESWNNLLDVLATAKETVGVRDQAVVDAAVEALNKAIDALNGIDYSYLEKQIALAERLYSGYYTEITWKAVEDALVIAKEALNSQDQAVVDDAARQLRRAIENLKRKPGQPTIYYYALNEQLEIARTLEEADYTRRSWAALQAVLDKISQEYYYYQVQELVDEATENLKNAIAALVKKPAPGELNFGDLENAIADAEGKNEADYTADSWANLQAAIEAAKAALNADEQIDIDAATDALQAVIDALVEMNYTDLNEQITAAEGKDETLYTAESWTAMQAALEAAKAALESKDQAVVDAAAAALKAAVEALTEMNFSELNDLIAEAEGKNEDLYTADSWAAMQAALESAKAVLGSNDQAIVTAAAEALKAAVEALVEMNYSDLNDLIAEAEGKNEAPYTTDSWAAMQAALEAAKAVVNSKDQAEVNAAAEALKAAIEALTKVDYSKLNAQIKATKGLYEDDYAADSWAALMAALADARAALESNDQAVVDAATAALKAALEALAQMDYTELNNQIAAAEGKNEADYTADSWTAMQAALADAKAALTSKDQAVVDAAAAALKVAIEALAQMDYTELNNQIAAAEGKNEADYTADSWTAMQTALNAAKAALTAKDQAVVDAAAAALKAAIEALELKPVTPPVDYSALIALIESTKLLNESDYTAKSWSALSSVLKRANFALVSTDQAEVDLFTALLMDAIKSLVKMDYTKLNEQIAAAEALKEADYTAASWAAMQEALTAAKAVKDAKDQAVVDAAADALKAAIAALETKPVMDYTELNNQIAAAEGKNEADYTADSWTAMQAALADAKAALESQDQAEINAAADVLKAAIQALTEMDYAELNNQIAAAEGKNEADYTAETWTAMQAALADAKAALESKDQAVVNAAAEALKAAVEALEAKPVIDNTELQSQIAAAEGKNEADYTAESWAAFKAALDAAKAAVNSNDQAAIDAAAAALKSAMDALEKKPVEPTVDTSKLAEQIAAAEALKEENYTSVSWATLKSSLEAAKAAMSSKDQAAIDSAAAALKAAIEALEEKAEEEAPVIWPWILVAVVVVLAVGAGVAYFLISKKKKEADTTPLVDYDISDDNE